MRQERFGTYPDNSWPISAFALAQGRQRRHRMYIEPSLPQRERLTMNAEVSGGAFCGELLSIRFGIQLAR
jgi:hypothetical protein